MVDCPISILACWSQFVAKGGDKGGERERYIYTHTYIYIQTKNQQESTYCRFHRSYFLCTLGIRVP